jgi:hypothetical protein
MSKTGGLDESMSGTSKTTGTNHQRLTDLRNGLLRLHKVLLDSERSIYEHDVAPITSPGHLLGLVMDDPWFAYLRELSGLIVAIDERLDEDEPTTLDESKQFIQHARALLSPAEEGSGFGKRYFEALQRDPDVVLAHGAMVRVFAGLD